MNQLVREDNGAAGKTWTWAYDNAGNILTRSEYAYTTESLDNVTPANTVSYTYGDDTWGDLLTTYDDVAITHDAIGNPLNDGTWSYTWENGRQLASMTDGDTTWTYKYNADGLRTFRSNGSTTYEYTYSGDQLVQLVVNSATESETASRDVLYFTSDTVTYNGTTYYYVTNLQGDVIAILNGDGYVVVAYTYDAWGSLISTSGTMADTLGTLNPLRYRGYVYDAETGLYYLQSRYYDPELGRFINADGYASTGQGLLGNNMFAYCGNNPIHNADSSGEAFFTVLGAVTGFIAGAATAALSNLISDEKVDVLEAGVNGAIGGAIAGAGVDTALLIVGTFGTALPAVALAGGVAYMAGGLGNVYTTYVTSEGTASDKELWASFHLGGIANLFSLGTSWGCAATNVEGLMIRGSLSFKANLSTGTGIALATSIATGMYSMVSEAE